MQIDFHYYATYCAAILAGFTHEESMDICYSAQFVDCCSVTLLDKVHAPRSAATTQLQLELMDSPTDIVSIQNITRIWSSFHFLPGNIRAERPKCTKRYLHKYRLICQPNGDLLSSTVRRAKRSSLQGIGIAMHILADTWAHRNFAGTPSLVINNVNGYFFELIPNGNGFTERKVSFKHNPGLKDDIDRSIYVNSLFQSKEMSIMNLGHGRAGHLPDYSFMRYKYLPAWGNYEEIIKDNPNDYIHAFTQMVHALRYLHGDIKSFHRDHYDFEAISPYEDEIRSIIEKRQLDSSEDWKAFGEKLSGCEIEPFDQNKYLEEYAEASAEDKDNTFLGKFIRHALAHKSMVTGAIFETGNLLAGISVNYWDKGFKGIKDYKKLLDVFK